MIEVILVRHAQASFAAADYDELSPAGEIQARLLGQYFNEQGLVFDACVSGSMRRHTQTIDAMLAGGLSLASAARHRHAGLNEYDFRQMVSSYRQLAPDDPDLQRSDRQPGDRRAYFRLLRRILSDWSEDRLQGAAESWTDFRTRVRDAGDRLHALGRDAAADGPARVLAVSSGGAICALIGEVLALDAERVFDLNMQIRNTALTRFYAGSKGFRLAEFNSLPHLAGPQHAEHRTFA